uniref:Methyltransferase small domain-containing protein n=1 Tax=Candidatus Kentrum sp. UNK TaxID=2126344 RepID=A0A451B587_9GAMM|nr:MAG: Methyltransferase small domain-containing protein [Candidatus Kentron sp. UNK]VFK73454.1 MAG: Methyltransferase small domain-containing protein [Candidatus Kentron sp. UNK]
MITIEARLEQVLARKRLTRINDYHVITDKTDYFEVDQVFPIYPEQQFFLDELDRDKIKGADALEIGLGSGVLSIGAARAGAAKVTALEINPRAKNTAGFNILMNGLEDRIAIIDGHSDVLRPVAGRTFDYIFSNPPFEPTPPDQDYFYNSAAGPFGLDFIEKLFQGVDAIMAPDGHLQIVTAAPGNDEGPFLLADLARRYLPGATRILVNPASLDYFEAVDWLPAKGLFTPDQATYLKDLAREAGVSRSFLCVLHYEKQGSGVQVSPSQKTYPTLELPLD